MFQTSLSKVETSRACEQRYVYRYIEKLRAKVVARPLRFGDLFHKMLEADANNLDPLAALKDATANNERLFREERESIAAVVSDITYIWKAYKDFYKKDQLQLLPVNQETKKTKFLSLSKQDRADALGVAASGIKAKKPTEVYAEHWIDGIEIAPGIEFAGKIDGFVRSRKMNWLLEHKTTENFPDSDTRWRNLQSCLYIRIVEMLGWFTLSGTLWNYIRSKPPTHMKPNEKNPGMSVRKIDSLPQVVIDDITNAGFDWKNYVGFIRDIEVNIPSWFDRVYTPIKKPVIDMVWRDFIVTSKEMKEVEEEYSAAHPRRPVRTIGRHCSWCEFEALCRAELTGADADFVREHEFEIRPPKEAIK
jgi:hypothetical protein